MIKIHIKIRIILWSILACVILWLLYMAVVPSGKITYVYDFKKDNYFISKLTPDARVEERQNNKQKIIGDPVYFSLRTPRRFNKAKLTLKYKRCKQEPQCAPANLPIIEVGALVDKTVWRYDLEPIENYIINQLALAWDMIEENGAILLQRRKKYNSIDEFLKNPPPVGEIALYNYDLKSDFILPGYIPGDKKVEFKRPLRGPYQFYTYIKGEDLDFTFFFTDINENKDPDPIDMNLYFGGRLIDARHLDDDGISEDNGRASLARGLDFKLSDLPEGVYKIELRSNDDIITDKIITKQRKLAFINKIWLYKSGRKIEDLNIFTDSRTLNAQTANPESLQTIKLADGDLSIDQTYKQFTSGLKGTSTKFFLEHDDIIISGDGVFSFTQKGLINPSIKKINAALDINGEGINYVIADYRLPKKLDGWQEAEARMDLADAYREAGKYSFIISIPGLKADDEIGDWIEADEIRINLTGKNLWGKIKEIFNL